MHGVYLDLTRLKYILICAVVQSAGSGTQALWFPLGVIKLSGLSEPHQGSLIK